MQQVRNLMLFLNKRAVARGPHYVLLLCYIQIRVVDCTIDINFLLNKNWPTRIYLALVLFINDKFTFVEQMSLYRTIINNRVPYNKAEVSFFMRIII
jgi:hypothetical protein